MSEWISAWDALMKVREGKPETGTLALSPATAERKISEALIAGRLRAHACVLIQECDDGLSPNYHVKRARDVRLNPHQGHDESEFAIFDTPIPTDFFNPEQGWRITQIGWELGRILAVRPSNHSSVGDIGTNNATTRRYITGLKFPSIDIDPIAENVGTPGDIKPIAFGALKSSKPGGKPVRLEVWEKFWFEVIKIIEPRKLSKSRLKSQANFRRLILTGTNDCMSEEGMIDTVRNIWKTFVEPKKRRIPGDKS